MNKAKLRERNGKIALAAARLFARQGYRGTSTREIARAAGISENTLFRHFTTKEEIFWTALRSDLSGLELGPELREGIEANTGPEVVLPRFLSQVAEVACFRPELVRMIAVALLELHAKAAEVCGEYLMPLFASVNEYVAANVEQGRLRVLDPPLVTAAMLVTVLAHPAFLSFSDAAAEREGERGDVLSKCSRFWVEVLVPPCSTGRKRPAVGPLPPART